MKGLQSLAVFNGNAEAWEEYTATPLGQLRQELALHYLAQHLGSLDRELLPLLRWLRQREIVAYLGGLLASGGFMSLFNRVILILSAPMVAMNIFSTWSWTYSEGAHYSASIVPFIIISAIYGLGFLAHQLSERWGIPHG